MTNTSFSRSPEQCFLTVVQNNFGNKIPGANETHCRPFDAFAELNRTEYNDYDEDSFWSGKTTNSFLVGMESEHDNGPEDRRYRYFYQNSKNWVLSECSWEDTNHYYDDDVDYKVNPGEVIAGNTLKKFAGFRRFSLQILWKRAVRITEKPYNT